MTPSSSQPRMRIRAMAESAEARSCNPKNQRFPLKANGSEYCALREYIHRNPVKGNLASAAEEYAYSSARAEFQMDGLPQRLKPVGGGA